ncbi:protein-disulfide reductase DsbD family protein [Sphingomonas nostoxanthinifaciens]|uniref:protein-disulfide reductase DsbD family protein n=1 Tax=Sphingomonas nostoxanthinifaciens TaxID=2872652 RepID=UPI001CC205EB|nr:thioredoxin family protein [Sphingomonas nostoxanthinifaciens]UAK24159.1 thioredoxin family protein [Sphingomonas nostoxanthinifaciens]
MIFTRFMLLLAALLALPSRAVATHIAPSLVAESLSPAAGSQVTLAFAMRPTPGWHGYWKNPGDAGVETRVAWSAPAGLQFGALRYPVPQTLLISGLMNYVYERDYAELVTLTVPKGLAAGTALPIGVKLDWLACNPQTCVPETATLTLRLTVGDGAAAPATRAQFDNWRAALPRPLAAAAQFQVAGGRLRLALPLPASAHIDRPYFFPLTDGAIDYAAPQTVGRDGDRLVIETAAKAGATPARIEGVVRLAPGTGVSFAATAGRVAAAPAIAAADEQGSAGGGTPSFLLALAGAILGGLLLNIMPCVFPILSLKAISLARSGESERHARIEAIAYTAGVVLVCLALGGVLLALRQAGDTAGWAFQLQNPRMIAGLMLLMLAIGLNLAGLFELPVIAAGGGLAAGGGASGAFWTGALAAFIATPCSGPFMGVALGAALLLPAAAALAIFAGLGLGLAIPFLALGFVPALRRLLPRPGAWMDTVRRILAVPMLLTALGLAWILGRQAGVDGMTLGLGAALLLALGLWWTGRRQGRLANRVWWPTAPALAGAAALIAIVSTAPAVVAQAAGNEPFSETRLAALRTEKRPVLLYFTADWCLTCKVNEKAAIERSEVAQAFAAHHVAVMVGDWTRGDPAITRFLAAHGRSGVPFYLFYPADGTPPRELPQVLTPGLLARLA